MRIMSQILECARKKARLASIFSCITGEEGIVVTRAVRFVVVWYFDRTHIGYKPIKSRGYCSEILQY